MTTRGRAEPMPLVLDRQKCRRCGYSHTGTGEQCEVCAGTAPLPPLAEPGPSHTAVVRVAALSAPGMAPPVCPAEPGATDLVAEPAAPHMDEDETPQRAPSPPRRQDCKCCRLSTRAALDWDLRTAFQTQREIARRHSVSMYSLTQHRLVCLGLPRYTKEESGQRRQALRQRPLRGPEGPAVTAARFAQSVRQQRKALRRQTQTIAEQQAQLEAERIRLLTQVEFLEQYLLWDNAVTATFDTRKGGLNEDATHAAAPEDGATHA